MRIYMSSVFLSVFALFVVNGFMALLATQMLLNSYFILGLLAMTSIMVAILLLGVLVSENRSKSIMRTLATKCTYNPFAKAIEVHMNDEAREQIIEKIDQGEYPGSALTDRTLLRKHYLDGIRIKMLKILEADFKVVIVAHSKSELNLLAQVPGNVMLKAGLFTRLAHTIGIRTYSIPKRCPKVYVPFIKLLGMFSIKHPVYWVEIEPSEAAIHWLNHDYQASDFIQ